MKLVALTNGGYARVDDQDYQRVRQFTWCRHAKGHAQRTGTGKDSGKTIYMHRFVINAPTGTEVDHRNHNKLDNRRCNIRLASPMLNQRNRRKLTAATSMFKGVYRRSGTRRWIARITVNKKRVHLSSFKTQTGAALAYNEAARLYFSEFACLNEV